MIKRVPANTALNFAVKPLDYVKDLTPLGHASTYEYAADMAELLSELTGLPYSIEDSDGKTVGLCDMSVPDTDTTGGHKHVSLRLNTPHMFTH